ncbi:MAG TPA: hypothetical protein PK209_12680 [Saprospiraceae bacterium]|nr:hypothetical protein [Saprospiraceae bacterium]
MGKWFLVLISVAVFFSSCSEKEDKPVGTLELVIKGRFGQNPLVMGQEYDFFDGSKIYFTKSEFFLSRIKLRTATGKIVPLSSSVRFVNLQDHHFTLQNAENGLSVIFDKIEVGEYDRFSFGIGVPPELNNKTPSDFPTSSPLSDGIHYWSGWDSYIFSKTEGSISDGTRQELFAYHSGFNDVYEESNFNKQIIIEEGKTTKLMMEFDHRALFGDLSNYINIYNDPVIHEGKDFMAVFMTYFRSALKI